MEYTLFELLLWVVSPIIVVWGFIGPLLTKGIEKVSERAVKQSLFKELMKLVNDIGYKDTTILRQNGGFGGKTEPLGKIPEHILQIRDLSTLDPALHYYFVDRDTFVGEIRDEGIEKGFEAVMLRESNIGLKAVWGYIKRTELEDLYARYYN